MSMDPLAPRRMNILLSGASVMDPLVPRVLARYKAASNHPTDLFMSIVKVVDDVDDALKKLTEAEAALKKLEALGASEFGDPDGDGPSRLRDKAYGFKQQLAWMREAIDQLQKAGSNFSETYDEFNRWGLRNGLK